MYQMTSVRFQLPTAAINPVSVHLDVFVMPLMPAAGKNITSNKEGKSNAGRILLAPDSSVLCLETSGSTPAVLEILSIYSLLDEEIALTK